VGALVGADLVIKADFDPMTGKYHDLGIVFLSFSQFVSTFLFFSSFVILIRSDGVGIVSAINIPASNVAEKSKFPKFFTSEGLKNHLLLAPGVKESGLGVFDGVLFFEWVLFSVCLCVFFVRNFARSFCVAMDLRTHFVSICQTRQRPIKRVESISVTCHGNCPEHQKCVGFV
jgi:hypothetical protein